MRLHYTGGQSLGRGRRVILGKISAEHRQRRVTDKMSQPVLLSTRTWLAVSAPCWIGPIIAVIVSLWMPKIYEGSVSMQIGRLGDIQSLTSSGKLAYEDKNRWVLQSSVSKPLIVDPHTLSRKVLAGNPSAPDIQVGAISRIEVRSDDVVQLISRGTSPEQIRSKLEQVSAHIIRSHETQYEAFIEVNKLEVRRLEKIERDLLEILSKYGVEIENSDSDDTARLFAVASIASELRDISFLISGIRILSKESTASKVIGEITVSRSPVSPNHIHFIVAGLILGLALSLTLIVIVIAIGKRRG
jgi:hypothetical protein